MKVNIESPQFLERIHGDICGPIHPSSGSFRYFMVLNRRIFKMVSCVPLIISQPDILKEISEPETQVNEELSISSSTGDGISLDRSKIIVDNVFAYDVALNIMQGNEDLEPLSVEECRQRCDWLKWQEAIQSELNSLAKREVFGPVVQTPSDVKSIGYKWVFVRKKK